jgi:hypothetical protein
LKLALARQGYSIASREPLTILADSGGLFQLNSDGSIAPIGFEKIDRTVFSRMGGANLAGIYAEMDPFFNRYYLAVKYSSSASFDRLIIYDWGIGEFTQISNTVGILFPLASGTLGYTPEGLSAVSASLDALPFSLDSKVWHRGAPVMAAIDATNKLGFYSGDNAEATVTTQEFGATAGALTRITEAMPVIDTQSTNTGIVRKRSRARYHSFRLRVPEKLGLDARARGNRQRRVGGSEVMVRVELTSA